MSTSPESRSAIVRYWERRRVIYNVVLVPPTAIAYLMTAGFAYVGDPHPTGFGYVVALVAGCAVGANLAYSIGYAFEILLQHSSAGPAWRDWGRSTLVTSGFVVSVALALFGGRQIALAEYFSTLPR